MGDVSVACVVEIPSGQVFLAERGAGLVEAPPVRLSRQRAPRPDVLDLRLPRPAGAGAHRGAGRADRRLLGRAAAPSTSGSAAFDMTRVATGQLDAYVEPGPRMVADVPGMRAEFERVGGGAVLNNSPYDLAAAALVLRGGGRGGDRRLRRAARRQAAAGLGRRVPDVGGRQRQPGAARAHPRPRSMKASRGFPGKFLRRGCRQSEPRRLAHDPAKAGYLVLARLALSAVCRLTPLEPGGRRPQAGDDRGRHRVRRRGRRRRGRRAARRLRLPPARGSAGARAGRAGLGRIARSEQELEPGDHRGHRRRVHLRPGPHRAGEAARGRRADAAADRRRAQEPGRLHPRRRKAADRGDPGSWPTSSRG